MENSDINETQEPSQHPQPHVILKRNLTKNPWASALKHVTGTGYTSLEGTQDSGTPWDASAAKSGLPRSSNASALAVAVAVAFQAPHSMINGISSSNRICQHTDSMTAATVPAATVASAMAVAAAFQTPHSMISRISSSNRISQHTDSTTTATVLAATAASAMAVAAVFAASQSMIN
jgi:hypothetical protein